MLIGRILGIGLALCAMLCAAPALPQPSIPRIEQYKHARWTVDDGAPAPIQALVQGKDGFIYIGAGDGLYRFDGVNFDMIPMDRPREDRNSITALMAARDGSIWVGYAAGAIARYASGTLRDTGVQRPTYVLQLAQTDDGAIWASVGRRDHSLIRFFGGRWTEIGTDWGWPDVHGSDLIVARDGTLWVSTAEGVYFLKKGSHKFERSPFRNAGMAALAEDASGTIWASDQTTLRPVLKPYSNGRPPSVPEGSRVRRAVFDRSGSLWGNTQSTGIYKVAIANDPRGMAGGTTDRFREKDTLTSDNVNSIIKDREGNIWVGTNLGIDRFRGVPVTFERSLSLIPQWGSTLLAASNGDVYVGQHDGVYRIRPNARPERILSDAGEAEAMCEATDGTLWFVMQQKIARLGTKAFDFVSKPESQQALIDCAVDHTGTLYVTAVEGMFQRSGTGWRLFPAERGDDTDGAMPIISRTDGTLLTYVTSSSLRVYRPPHFTDVTLSKPAALSKLKTLYARSDAILAGGAFGLAKWQGDTFKFLSRRRVAALRGVFGIAPTPSGYTWLMASRNIVRVATADLDRAFDMPSWIPPIKLFGYFDGLTGVSVRDGKRDAVRGGDGRIWFATTNGVVWIDPSTLPHNTLPPPVAIGALHVGGKSYRDPQHFDVPAGSERVAIDFSALSMGIPQRVKVLYRLEGVDSGWIDAGMTRSAAYTNLSPGSYRFHVIAANEDGVWNKKGAILELTILPTFFQSQFFSALCIVAALFVLWLAYSLRTRQLTARVRERLGAQMAERERIARELHDTLLQGFQGLILRFQSVANRMSRDHDARQAIDEALDRAETVITDARNRVNDLRQSDGEIGLFDALTDAATRLDGDSALPISVTVEGQARALTAIVNEELLRIAEEAIRNAVQHAGASHIEVALMYGRDAQLVVRDDGSGLPADILNAGRRAGHFGLIGMRERAERIGGHLSIVSNPDAGTEISVTVPGRLAFYAGRARLWGML